MEENRTYRIRTKIGDDADKVINVKLDQHYDSFEILSLKINQSNNYKFYESDYGVVVGRVLANGGFGIPNAKVSIFIESDDNDDMETRIMYPYKSVNAKNQDGVRYNLLTDFLDKACYQNVGTFPNKRYVLDNNDVIDVFDKYYRYTTVTNNAGDYMIFGVPTGSQRLHVDIDLSDIGMLSQRPRDMIYKGYNINQFESPNKFKQDTNLNSLAQIISQDLGLYVYPYWGDTSETDDNIAVTRADINVDYKFEPTCVFMGSIITDTGSNAIGKNCTSTEKIGKMSELIAGEGSIEMIRKTIDGKVEEFQVKGNRVIDGDGVWCYQIPMNLDYIMTDEFGNIVPSDNPEKGIPTRTRVRFRISVDDAPDDNTARKRCRYLVPNNPRLDEELYPNFTKTKEVDYEFGTRTRDENYRDLLWNKVYTVKNYVPRLQKNRKITDRKHTGIKLINHHEANNPMPYNNVDIKLGFTYRLLCVIFKIFINLVQFLNQILTALSLGFCAIYKVFDFIADKLCFRIFGIKPLCWMAWPFRQLANFFKALIVPCVAISSEMCGGNTTHNNTFYPGCGNLMFSGAGAGKLADCIRQKTTESLVKKEDKKIKDGEMDESERTSPILGGTEELYNCVETALAEDNDTVSLNFQNDWINGTLYAPMWFRKITKKRTYLFGLIKRSAKDQWCEGEKDYTRKILRVFNPCSPKREGKNKYTNFRGENVDAYYMNFSDNKNYKDSCGDRCHESTQAINLDKGLIVKRKTMLGQDVYYYKPVEYSSPLTSLIKNNDDFAVSEEGNEKGGSVKILFATDIVLLGSLNDCDMHGVPQFFKSLESTTFQVPPNILFTDNEVVVTMEKGSSKNANDDDPDNVSVTYSVTEHSTSEMTGMDWGNFNDDICGKWNDSQDSGLFYSIGCSTIRMKPKSCINMSRICEYGVSLDETKSVLDHSKNVSSEESPSDDAMYDTIVPDGFISKDEIYNDDERSMFATLNINGLSTKRNSENGLMEYVFNHVVVDNFDKSLYVYMSERQAKCSKTQKYNYLLEEFSNGYYDFRMGKKPYFYDKNHKFPRYENSFYFYFGLNAGKTAIDKFNSQFTSNCTNDGEDVSPIGIDTKPNSWCVEMDLDGDFDDSEYGYAAFDLSLIDLPCDIIIRSITNSSLPEIVIKDNDKEKFYISKVQQVELENDGYEWYKIELPYDINADSFVDDSEFLTFLLNGTYELILTDSNGEIITTEFSMKGDGLKSNIIATEFFEGEEELLRTNGTLCAIGFDSRCIDGNITINSTRGIGGTIAVSWPYNERTGDKLDNFSIELTSSYAENHSCLIKLCCGNDLYESANCIKLLAKNNDVFLFGVPKGDVVYNVKITELCCNLCNESNNTYEESVLVPASDNLKLLINGTVDYDVIKHWKCGFICDADTETVQPDHKISDKWWNMSDPENYLWFNFDTYNEIDKKLVELYKTYINVKNQITGSGYTYTGIPLVSGVDTNNSFLKKATVSVSDYNDNDYDWSPHENKNWDRYITDDDYSYILNDINTDITRCKSYADASDDEHNKACFMALIEIDNEAKDLLYEIKSAKEEFINETKRAFQLSCPEEDKNLFFTAKTRNRPVKYHMLYKPEFVDEDETGISYNTVECEYSYVNDEDNISDITIPTISYWNSDRFGNHDGEDSAEKITMLEKTLCYAVDNLSDCAFNVKKRKYCNFVAIINSRAKRKPNDVEPPEYALCPDGVNPNIKLTKKYFGFHIIDKIFDKATMAWSVIDNIPYYKPLQENPSNCIDENKAGVSMCMNGLFTGKLFNGNPFEEKVLSGNCGGLLETDFSQQSLGDFNLKIYTGKDADETIAKVEDKLPTRRYIVDGISSTYGESTDNDRLVKKPYENYRVSTTEESNQEAKDDNKLWGCTKKQYSPVINYGMDLLIEDENYCQLIDTIDGRMKIRILNSSANICSTSLKKRRSECKLNVELINTANSESWVYLVFSAKDGDYPLNLSEKATPTYYSKDIDNAGFANLVTDGLFDTNEDGSFIDPAATEYYYEDSNGNEVLINPDNEGDIPDDAQIYHKVDEDRLEELGEDEQLGFEKIPENGCRSVKFDCKNTDGSKKLFNDNNAYLFSYYNNVKSYLRIINPFGRLFETQGVFGDKETVTELSSTYAFKENDKEIATEGYGNTGEFDFSRITDYDNAYYVIAVTDNNVRTISPVYDFCYLCAKLIFGVVYTKQETTDEDGFINGYTVVNSPKATFDIGNVITGEIVDGCVKPGDVKYYFYYYPYDINFECKLDDINVIKGSYHHLSYRFNKDGYKLFDISESAYKSLDQIYENSNCKVGKTIHNNTTIEAFDVTGLRHIPDWIGCKKKVPCDPCSGGTQNGCVPYEKNIWVTITWVTNGGTWVHCSDDTDCKKYIDSECGCIEDDDKRDDACMYGSDGNYTRVFKKDDVYNPYDVGCLEREGCGGLIGWSTSYDSNKPLESAYITIEGKPEDSMIYYAIWDCDFATVTWLDCDGTTVLYTEDGVKKGIMLTEEDLPESLDPDNIIKGWKVDGTDVTFPYEIKKDTVFTAICGASCKPSLRLINCADIGRDHINIVYMTMWIFENEQDAESGTPLKTISITWGPERMGSPDNPSLNNEDTYRHANAYDEGNVVRFEITAIELSNGCLIYPENQCIEQLQGDGGDECRREITEAFCQSVSVNQPDDIIIGRACAGSQAKAVITLDGVDCSCTVMHRVVWKWGYDRNGDGINDDVIKVDYYVCEHDSVMHPQGITREGCTFNGWSLEGTDEIYDMWDAYPDVTSDLTFVAQWVCNDEPVVEPHSVTFVDGVYYNPDTHPSQSSDASFNIHIDKIQ